jgi:hypothetical protein
LIYAGPAVVSLCDTSRVNQNAFSRSRRPSSSKYLSVGVPEEELGDGDCADRLVDPAGSAPAIWFQVVVPEKKTLKNRLHLDVLVGGGRSVPVAFRRQRARMMCGVGDVASRRVVGVQRRCAAGSARGQAALLGSAPQTLRSPRGSSNYLPSGKVSATF